MFGLYQKLPFGMPSQKPGSVKFQWFHFENSIPSLVWKRQEYDFKPYSSLSKSKNIYILESCVLLNETSTSYSGVKNFVPDGPLAVFMKTALAWPGYKGIL